MTDKCVFCGKSKGDNWQSSIDIILPNSYGLHIFEDDDSRNHSVLTVCPQCRQNHTIQELYQKSIEAQLEEAKKYFIDNPNPSVKGK